MKLKAFFQSCRFTSCSQSSHSDLTVIVCFIIAAVVICFCIPVCVCVCVSGTVDDRLAPCVWPIAVCELQGQAVEGRAGDLSLRIELISLITRRPLLPLLSLYAVLLWRWRAFLSVFACIHYGWCGWSCLVNLLKFMSCVHTRGHVYTESIQIEICKKKVTKQNPWVVSETE